MDMQKLLNIVSGKKQLNESITECGCDGNPAPAAPAPQVNPMSMTVNMNAQGIDQIKDLMGLFAHEETPAQPVQIQGPTEPMDSDSTNMIMKLAGVKGESASGGFDKATTAPDEEIKGIEDVIPSGNDLNRAKNAYPKAQDGDNAMAVKKERMEETIRARLKELYAQISEGK